MSRAFDVAWWFHVSPSETLALPIADLVEWEREAHRLKRAIQGR